VGLSRSPMEACSARCLVPQCESSSKKRDFRLIVVSICPRPPFSACTRSLSAQSLGMERLSSDQSWCKSFSYYPPQINVPQSKSSQNREFRQFSYDHRSLRRVHCPDASSVCLSYDHRLLDGREAVTLLVRIKNYLESPSSMLLPTPF
jgi:hypothetical protein